MILKLIPKKAILYVAASIILLLVGAFGGYTFCKRAQYKGVIKQQEKDAKTVLKHQEDKDNVNEKFTESVEEIKAVKESCLDKPNSDDYLNRLQRSDSISESIFN